MIRAAGASHAPCLSFPKSVFSEGGTAPLRDLPAGADTVEFANQRTQVSTGSALSTAAQTAANAVPGPAGALLKVLTLNVMFDCQAGVDQVAHVIRESGADLVGLQESVRNTRVLAKKLGMHYLQQDKRTALLSRYPLEKVTPHRYAVQVSLPNGARVAYANAHLTSFPFQSHQLCHLPSGGGPYLNTEAEAVESADNTRGDEVRTMIRESNSLNLPAIATGDFNEPSRLDWTQAAADLGRNPIKVDWPASRQFAEAGFTDGYREKYPNEIEKPGFTWTPTKEPDDPTDHPDRIDYVMYRGDALKLKSIEIVGEKAPYADLVVQPWPSDHRGVLATFEVAAG